MSRLRLSSIKCLRKCNSCRSEKRLIEFIAVKRFACIMSKNYLFKLENTIQNYAWGSKQGNRMNILDFKGVRIEFAESNLM